MIDPLKPADPAIHQAAQIHAWRCVGIVAGLLREEEIPDAAREFYAVALEFGETLKKKLQRPGP